MSHLEGCVLQGSHLSSTEGPVISVKKNITFQSHQEITIYARNVNESILRLRHP